MTTYGDCNTAEDAAVTADTETLVMDIAIPSGRGGRIKEIRVSYGNVVDAKAATGFVELKLGSHSGPYRYPVGRGNGGAANTSFGTAEKIEVDIPVDQNETVKGYVTLNEAAVDAHVGIVWEAGGEA